MLRIIAAVDERGGLSRHGVIPWASSGDWAHFRRLTRKSTVLMGRVTFEDIGHPLPGRTNVVLSHRPDFVIPGCTVYADLTSALRQYTDIWVIGGASVYAQTLHFADEVHLTEISGDYACDRFFPDMREYKGKVFRYQFAATHKTENGAS